MEHSHTLYSKQSRVRKFKTRCGKACNQGTGTINVHMTKILKQSHKWMHLVQFKCIIWIERGTVNRPCKSCWPWSWLYNLRSATVLQLPISWLYNVRWMTGWQTAFRENKYSYPVTDGSHKWWLLQTKNDRKNTVDINSVEQRSSV